MKTIFSISLLALLMMGLVACEDFLAREPIAQLTTANAYKTASDAEAALTGAYNTYHEEFYIWDNIVFSDVISDNYYAGGDDPEIFSVEDLTLSPVNGRLFRRWSELYNGIAKANLVLDRAPAIADATLDVGNRRQQILGEATFLRACHYYHLVTLWGGVPLITKLITSTDPAETQKARNSEAEVYAQIITDLEFAVQNLLDTYGTDASVNKARATKGAAHALLAKVHAQQADRNYALVLEHCNAVINSTAGYTLLPDFTHLFDGNHYNNAESILEVQFTGGPEGNWGPGLVLPSSRTGDTWRKLVTPSRNLVAAFDNEGDMVRKNASILFDSAEWSDEFWSLSVKGVIPFAYKWKTASNGASTNRQYILRLGDIVLLKAEALNELNQLEAARVEIDRVRARVGLAPTPASTKAEMKLAIENERRLELTQEGQRWNDLKRYGRAVEVMNNLQELDLRTNSMKVYNMTLDKELLPIPQQERDRNKLLDQNPGYN